MAAKKTQKKPKRGIELEGSSQKKSSKPREKQSNKFRKFLENVFIQRMSDYKAALDAGYSKSVAKNTKHVLWKQKQAKKVLEEVCMSVNVDELKRNFQLGLNAMKVQFVGKDARPEVTLDLAERREWHRLLKNWLNLDVNAGVNLNGDIKTVNVIMPKE